MDDCLLEIKVQSQLGTDVRILKIFSRKKMSKNWRF
jgi:hypothetical protein